MNINSSCKIYFCFSCTFILLHSIWWFLPLSFFPHPVLYFVRINYCECIHKDFLKCMCFECRLWLSDESDLMLTLTSDLLLLNCHCDFSDQVIKSNAVTFVQCQRDNKKEISIKREQEEQFITTGSIKTD